MNKDSQLASNTVTVDKALSNFQQFDPQSWIHAELADYPDRNRFLYAIMCSTKLLLPCVGKESSFLSGGIGNNQG